MGSSFPGAIRLLVQNRLFWRNAQWHGACDSRGMPRSLSSRMRRHLLGVSRRTVYYRIREGRLQTVRTRRVAAGAAGVDRGAAPGGTRAEFRGPGAGASDTGPSAKCPSALAAGSSRPWCSRSAALIISHSMRVERRQQLVAGAATAISWPFMTGWRRLRHARRGCRSEMASGCRVEFGFGERDHAADFVLQLADVARPAIEQQALHRLFGDLEVAFLVLVLRRRRRTAVTRPGISSRRSRSGGMERRTTLRR